MNPSRIAVAMSGGVDSSVAAVILKESGHDVVGFSMQLWNQRSNPVQGEEPRTGTCCSLEDFHDARSVAAALGIPYYVVNLEREFEREVVQSFVEEYREGLTPSPCVLCNSHMKFDHLLQMAERVRATHVATGHYARIEFDRECGRYGLLKGRDPGKDQSYFLFGLSQEQLARALFPLGGLEKSRVREIAHAYGLGVAKKPESQEICFVPDGDYAGFVERHHPELPAGEPGEIVNSDGRVLGSHPGIHHYTIGQRRGLNVSHSEPLYVIGIEPRLGRVVVGERSRLAGRQFPVVRLNWVSVAPPARPVRARVKIRSRHSEAEATLAPSGSGRWKVEFDEPQLAITPGQAAVFYEGDRVLGGGWIARD
jgi:tRNA-specific 2-thiouridylase